MKKALLKQKDYFKIWLVCLIFGILTSRKQLQRILESQTAKGIAKYGKDITACKYNDYNWTDMALEEIIDFAIYVKKLKNEL
jgi:ABC-type metal ion transport system substrate-binding protein